MANLRVVRARPQAPQSVVRFHEWVFPDGTVWTQFYRTADGYLLRFPDLADFQVTRDGLDVICWPAPGVPELSVQHLYLNQVLPLALGRQGKLVFHASAVEIDGVAVAFLGESGRGKSTLAASFATGGSRFLTDDGLVVETVEGEWQVVPSHPSIRLWEDSEAALVGAGAHKAPPVSYTFKARILANNDIVFCDVPRRLRRAYFLGSGDAAETTFSRLQPGEALIELVKHSFLLDIEEREMLAAHFDELSRLASRPIYYRLDYPRRFDALTRIRKAIVDHMRTEGAAA